MTPINSGKSINSESKLYNYSSVVSEFVVKEILNTEITPTSPEMRLDHWRHKMRSVMESPITKSRL